MNNELRGGPVQAGLSDQDHSVQTGLPNGSYKPFRESIQVRRPGGESHRFDACRLEDHPKVLTEHAGPIMNEIAAAVQEPVQTIGQIPSHLLHPRPIRFRDDPRDVNLPRGQSNHEQNVVTDQTQSRPQFHAEKVGRGQHFQMGAQELLPGGSLLPVRHWVNPGLLEHLGNGATPNFMAEVLQGTLDAGIAPGAILRSHFQD